MTVKKYKKLVKNKAQKSQSKWPMRLDNRLKDKLIEHESVSKSLWCSHTPSNTLYIEKE